MMTNADGQPVIIYTLVTVKAEHGVVMNVTISMARRKYLHRALRSVCERWCHAVLAPQHARDHNLLPRVAPLNAGRVAIGAVRAEKLGEGLVAVTARKQERGAAVPVDQIDSSWLS